MELADSSKVVGVRQATKAINDGVAVKAYIANSIDEAIKAPFIKLCNKKNIPIVMVSHAVELGKACDIDVPASVAVIVCQSADELPSAGE